ncbi:MAG: M23 family metallopeptidase [Treponema sp.]|uniref:M23 family metallopeptidase n=1 Tax=Treponema sp. TaxID=166 RepID=UPI0025FA79BE|nr:M23 family metallopeptidase [Treponema sp.]MBQ8680224.1 M23 family metallopeptidase [Treponema sp.]
MKFFEKEEKALYSQMNGTRKGCFPISNQGIWHSGIHVYYDNESTVVTNPVSGTIVSSSIDKEKDWGYLVTENDIIFPDQKTKIHCYNVISNLRGKNCFHNIKDDSDFSDENIEILKNLPFYVKTYIKVPDTACTDKNNFKRFYCNLDYSKIIKTLDSNSNEIIKDTKKFSDYTNKYILIKDTNVYSDKKCIGKLTNNFTVLKSSLVANQGLKSEIKIYGKNIELDNNLPTGEYILKNEETINDYGNIKRISISDLILWNEDKKSTSYPNFGILVKKNDKIWDELENSKDIDLSIKENIKSLINSIDSNNGSIYLIPESCKDKVYPFIEDEKNVKETFKIFDNNNELVKPFVISDNLYRKITDKKTGFFTEGKFYKSIADHWKDSKFSFCRMIKTNVSENFGSVFTCIKLIDDNGNPIETYKKTSNNNLFYKVKLHFLEGTEYKVKIDNKEIFSQKIYISNKNVICSFENSDVENGCPNSEALENVSGKIEVLNLPEIITDIKTKDYLWLRNLKQNIFINKENMSKLKVSLEIPQKLDKGTFINTGAKLGFPYNRQPLVENTYSETKNFIDYALFFEKDFRNENTKLNKIYLKKNTDCLIEERIFKETEESIYLPPYCELETENIDKEYVKLKSFTASIYAYKAQIYEKKLLNTATEIFLYNKLVELKNKDIISIEGENNQNNLSKIKDFLNEIIPVLQTQDFSDSKDGKGNFVYEYKYKKTFSNKIIKKQTEKNKSHAYVKNYEQTIEYKNDKTTADFTQISSRDDLDEVTIETKKYVRFQIDERMVLVDNNEVEKNTKNLLDDYFKELKNFNFGDNSISNSNICPDNELLIQHDSKKKNINELKNQLRAYLGNGTDEEKNLIEYVYDPSKTLPDDESGFAIYASDKPFGDLLEKFLSKTISLHPLEWDFEKQKGIEARGICKHSDKDCDIFSDLKKADKKNFSKNSFYFVSAPKFYNNMETLGLMFRNPYEGKTYGDLYNTANGVSKGIDMSTKVIDSPGFAPVYNTKHEKNIDGWAGTNGFFNQDYGSVHSSWSVYYHEGVDFAGVLGTPIKSLIYGEVIDLGTHKNTHSTGTGMGDYMIVRDGKDKNKYYLLLHLNWESWKKYGITVGTKVSPDMTVAEVGTQEYATAYHLHMSVICLKPNEYPIPTIKLGKKEPGVIRDENYTFPIWLWKNKNKMRNPFNHKEEWKGRN